MRRAVLLLAIISVAACADGASYQGAVSGTSFRSAHASAGFQKRPTRSRASLKSRVTAARSSSQAAEVPRDDALWKKISEWWAKDIEWTGPVAATSFEGITFEDGHAEPGSAIRGLVFTATITQEQYEKLFLDKNAPDRFGGAISSFGWRRDVNLSGNNTDGKQLGYRIETKEGNSFLFLYVKGTGCVRPEGVFNATCDAYLVRIFRSMVFPPDKKPKPSSLIFP